MKKLSQMDGAKTGICRKMATRNDTVKKKPECGKIPDGKQTQGRQGLVIYVAVAHRCVGRLIVGGLALRLFKLVQNIRKGPALLLILSLKHCRSEC
jgi:hypothetical protein